jgi:predicted metal-binding protein
MTTPEITSKKQFYDYELQKYKADNLGTPCNNEGCKGHYVEIPSEATKFGDEDGYVALMKCDVCSGRLVHSDFSRWKASRIRSLRQSMYGFEGELRDLHIDLTNITKDIAEREAQVSQAQKDHDYFSDLPEE